MKDIYLTELFKKFDNLCLEVSQQQCYYKIEDFINDVYDKTAGLLMDIYGDDEDTVKRRIFERIDDYCYRDPVTGTPRTFLEWSRYFNDDFDVKDNLIDLFNKCVDLKDENQSLMQEIRRLSTKETLKDQTPLHTKVFQSLTSEDTKKAYFDFEKQITELGFNMIRNKCRGIDQWLEDFDAELSKIAQDTLELSEYEWIEYLKEVWNNNTYSYYHKTMILSQWSEFLSKEIVSKDDHNAQ